MGAACQWPSPVCSVMPLARTVQPSGAVTDELEDGLEVGLVEGGEDPLDVFHEELGVEVGLAVGGVGEAVHALAGAGVAHGGVDAQFVRAGGEAVEGEPVAVEGLRVEGASVEGDGAQFCGLELDEGVPGGPWR